MAAATEPTIAVRAAEEGDIEAIASLCAQLGYPASVDEMRMRYARVRAAQAGEILVAVRSKEAGVIGWTHIVPRVQLEEAAFAELAGFVVDASVRGAGVGAVLLAAAEDWARRQGLGAMRVRSNVVREGAHRFYEREGYARLKAQQVFRKAL